MRVYAGLFALALLTGCVAFQNETSAAVPSALQIAAALPLVPDMTGDEIKAKFIGKRTEFHSADVSNQFTAVGMWDADGAVQANWKAGSKSGIYSGHYTLEGNKYCLTDGPSNGGKTHCGHFREQGDQIYQINENGTLEGIHTIVR